MELHLELPDDDELEPLIAAAYALAVTRYGPDPPYEEVRRIFFNMLFSGPPDMGE